MRYALLAAIRLYWLIPKKNRKMCIFKESCSHYVYRITQKNGLRKGLSAIKYRKLKCKPGYYFINNLKVRLADQSIIQISLLNEKIL